MDRIKRMDRNPNSLQPSRARVRRRSRTPGLRLEWLEGRVVLSVLPPFHIMIPMSGGDIGTGNPGALPHVPGLANRDTNPAQSVIEADPAALAPRPLSTIALKATLNPGNAAGPAVIEPPVASAPATSGVASLQGVFVSGGVLTIGSPSFPGNSSQGGALIPSGGGAVDGSDSGSRSGSATGSGTVGGSASNSAPSAGGAVATTSSAATNSAASATNTAGNATSTANLGTTVNAAPWSSPGGTGGGIPVAAGQLTLFNGSGAANLATSGALAGATVPPPAMIETITGNLAGLQEAVAGAVVSDSTATVSTTVLALNPKGTSPVTVFGDLGAGAGGPASAASNVIGTSASSGLIQAQNRDPGRGAILSAVAVNTPPSAANPAPHSTFLDPDPDPQRGNPQTIPPDPFSGMSESPDSSVPDAVDVPAPAETSGKALGGMDIDFDIEGFPEDQAVAARFTDSTMISKSALTGSGMDAAETPRVTTSRSVLPIHPVQDSDARASAGELVVMSSILASHCANLAFGSAISNSGTISWAARHWPATRRSKEAERPSPKLRSPQPG
jgi:hypothetical protein